MIAQSFFTGYVFNQLRLSQNEAESQYLKVILRVKKVNRKEIYYAFDIWNADALYFKQKVSKGDLISITAEPQSNLDPFDKEQGFKYKQGFKIILFEVLKKKEMK